MADAEVWDSAKTAARRLAEDIAPESPESHVLLAEVLTADADAGADAEATLTRIERLVEAHWRPPEDVLVDAFSMRAGYERGMRDGGKAAQSTFVAAKSRTEEE